MNKLDNLGVILSCMFIGSCFTSSQNKVNTVDAALKTCTANENVASKEDCDSLSLKNSWVKNFYNDQKNPQFKTTERLYDLSFKQKVDE